MAHWSSDPGLRHTVRLLWVPPEALSRGGALGPRLDSWNRTEGEALCFQSLPWLLTHMKAMITKARRQGPIMFQMPLRSSCRDIAMTSVPRRYRTWMRHRNDYRVMTVLDWGMAPSRTGGQVHGSSVAPYYPPAPLPTLLGAAGRICSALPKKREISSSNSCRMATGERGLGT